MPRTSKPLVTLLIIAAAVGAVAGLKYIQSLKAHAVDPVAARCPRETNRALFRRRRPSVGVQSLAPLRDATFR